MQEKLIRNMPDWVYTRAATCSKLLLQAASLLEIPCIASLQYPNGLGGMDPEIEKLLPDSATVVEKTRFSCVGVGKFDEALASTQRQHVCLVGMEAHICILQTAIDLQAAGYRAFVVEDAICSRKRENYENARHRMRAAEIGMPRTESVLYEWLRDASHEHFKSICMLVRTRLHGDKAPSS